MGSSRAAIRKEITRSEMETKWLHYRLRILPEQLEAARRKVRALENEATRYGLTHLVEKPNAA